jgi:xanthine dehydrogenase small subunit
LYVQQPDNLIKSSIHLIKNIPSIKYIQEDENTCYIGAGITASQFENSSIIQQSIPNLDKFHRLFASRLIKNTATLGGNLINASPIADFIILFLALDAQINLKKNGNKRQIPLNEFYLDYKKLDRSDDEILEGLEIGKLGQNSHFNFEKVSKRTHLDIASVNSAILLTVEDNSIKTAHLSAGGVAPIPKYLKETCNYLVGKEISAKTVKEAATIALSEISPISDIRGSKEYKTILLKQLIFAHFISLYPNRIQLEEVVL